MLSERKKQRGEIRLYQRGEKKSGYYQKKERNQANNYQKRKKSGYYFKSSLCPGRIKSRTFHMKEQVNLATEL